MEKLKIGVIGTGHMGRNHVRNLSDEKQFNLIGVYDKNADQAKKIADEFETAAYSDPEALLKDVEAVVVAVPSSLHKETGLMVAEHGVHALIEKPLALNSTDAKEIADAFRKKDLILAVGHIERFNPVILELKKLVNRRDIFYIEAHRYSPFTGSGRITDTSVVEDLMIHDIDLICHLMEPHRVLSINGLGENIRSDHIDFATCTLQFSEDVHATINASRVSQEKERTISVHMLDSCITADLLLRTLTIAKNTDVVFHGNRADSIRQEGVVEKIFVPSEEPLRRELLSFYQSVTERRPASVDGDAGIRAIRICEEVVQKIRELPGKTQTGNGGASL